MSRQPGFSDLTLAVWPSNQACLGTKRAPPVEGAVRHPSGSRSIGSVVIRSRFTLSYCRHRLEFHRGALGRGDVGWKWVQMPTDGSQVSCGQRWGCAELAQRMLFRGLSSYCQETLTSGIRDWGMAGKGSRFPVFSLFLKGAPVLRVPHFVQEKLCVGASGAPQGHSVLQSSDVPFLILPNKNRCIVFCFPPLKNGMKIAC